MRIYSKAAFQLGPGANKSGDIDSFITVPNAFQDMPDRFANDKTFKLAVKCGMVTVINNEAKQVEVENNEDKASNVDIDPVKQYYEKLKTMNKEDVASEADKLGIKVDMSEKFSEVKKKVFEAYKLSIK